MSFKFLNNYFFVLYFLLFFVLIGIGYFASSNFLDPDFGWHLKTGELILEKGVPQVDWYSFTMLDFQWVNHSWLTDILIYKIYSLFNLQILLLVFLIINTLAFIIWLKRKNFKFYLLPILLGFLSIMGFIGIRPQIITVLFIAILWKILIDFLEKEKIENKLIYFLPLLFVFWVNLHGGFFSGLFVLFLVLILEIFKKTNIFKKLMSFNFFVGQKYKEISKNKIFLLFFVLIFSFLFTLINPYGIRVYEEVFRSAGDSFLRFHIIEWMPLFSTNSSLFLIFYFSLFVGLLICLRKKIEITKLILITSFLILSLLNQRHFFIFVILSLPIFIDFLFILKKIVKIERVRLLFEGYRKWIILFFIFSLFYSGFYPFFKKSTFLIYPNDEAISFLKTLPFSDNLFNEYSWGGYLIWKIPERKVFIDGRMPSWRKDRQFVFGDYIKIIKSEKDFYDLLNRYNIKIMILKKETKKDKSEKTIGLNLWFLKVSNINLLDNFYQKFIDIGWQIVYEDDVTIILRR